MKMLTPTEWARASLALRGIEHPTEQQIEGGIETMRRAVLVFGPVIERLAREAAERDAQATDERIAS